jgi:hypothetical protein
MLLLASGDNGEEVHQRRGAQKVLPSLDGVTSCVVHKVHNGALLVADSAPDQWPLGFARAGVTCGCSEGWQVPALRRRIGTPRIYVHA